MTLNELKEQIQENILTYMDSVESSYLDTDRQWVYDDLCQVIVDTFDDTFYDSSMTGIEIVTKPLDTAPENVVECTDCGNTAPCLCEE